MRAILLAALAVVLVSCSNGGDKKAESTGKIIENYTNTLTSAPGKAKGAAEKEDERNSSVEKTLKELDK